MSHSIELLEPLKAAQPVHFKVALTNNGKTAAKQLHTELMLNFSSATLPFKAEYTANASGRIDHNEVELTPGAATIVNRT